MAFGAVVFVGPERAWADMAAEYMLGGVPSNDGVGLVDRHPATGVGRVPRLTDLPSGT